MLFRSRWGEWYLDQILLPTTSSLGPWMVAGLVANMGCYFMVYWRTEASEAPSKKGEEELPPPLLLAIQNTFLIWYPWLMFQVNSWNLVSNNSTAGWRYSHWTCCTACGVALTLCMVHARSETGHLPLLQGGMWLFFTFAPYVVACISLDQGGTSWVATVCRSSSKNKDMRPGSIASDSSRIIDGAEDLTADPVSHISSSSRSSSFGVEGGDSSARVLAGRTEAMLSSCFLGRQIVSFFQKRRHVSTMSGYMERDFM